LIQQWADWTKPIIVAGGFFWVLLLFGFLSRRFERQADVFAARTMQTKSAQQTSALPLLEGPVFEDKSVVGAHGATVFASALERVAIINNIPTGPRTKWSGSLRNRLAFVVERAADLAHNWLHGSIQERQEYVRRLGADPNLTGRFDRFMFHLYSTLLFLLFASVTFIFAMWK
jgi:Zn-dependent protease with chaperone function